MRIKIVESLASGKVFAPPSKSMAHRLLICAAMSERSTVRGVDFSEDIKATLDCLRALGAEATIDGSSITIGGLCPEKFAENAELYCRESGSTLRFFLPICLLSGKKASLFGSERLLERPLKIYEELCEEEGFFFSQDSQKVAVCGKLSAGEYSLRGDVSSQFITGLIFALVLAGGESKIKITGKAESLSYIKLTVCALQSFGARVSINDQNEVLISGGKIENRDLTVEGDYSNAAFFDALNVLGGDVEVLGLNPESLQGDRVYKDAFKCGEEPFDLADCPDLAPIAFAVAAFLGGGKFVGTKRLKIKEGDRAEAMKTELEKLGIQVCVSENEVSISGELSAPKEPLFGHNDHRIVMALSVLLTKVGGVIEGAEAVAKSFPDFFEKLESVGIKTEVESL